MVKSRGRPRKNREEEQEEEEKEEEEEEEEEEGGDASKAEYEEYRAQRIKQNAERMKSLGLFDLSKNLKVGAAKTLRKSRPASAATSNDPPRRSSRLKEVPTVSYSEKKIPNKGVVEKVEIHIEEGKNLEIYTEEHEKLLGDSKADWDLYVDGFDEDGQRMYDPVAGKTCHQCRQKALGLHTKCYKCKLAVGQFCGDCLYMRYGENVNEANENPEWVCPVCRGICNCSRCRRVNGWMPTGAIYNKVVKLGFKSVAHYLIYTFRGQAVLAGDTLPIDDDTEELTMDAPSVPSLGGSKKNEGEKHDMRQDSDEDYKGDDYEEDDGNSSSSSENNSQ